jgi:hypothetical protein
LIPSISSLDKITPALNQETRNYLIEIYPEPLRSYIAKRELTVCQEDLRRTFIYVILEVEVGGSTYLGEVPGVPERLDPFKS